jgi:hypothetical protein
VGVLAGGVNLCLLILANFSINHGFSVRIHSPFFSFIVLKKKTELTEHNIAPVDGEIYEVDLLRNTRRFVHVLALIGLLYPRLSF